MRGARTITHSQYELLRTFPTEPTQRRVWPAPDAKDRKLVAAGLLFEDSGGGLSMTDAGRNALVAYRERWKVPA